MLLHALLYLQDVCGGVGRDEELVPDLDLSLGPGVELVDTLYRGIVPTGDTIDGLLALYLVLPHSPRALCEGLHAEGEEEG